MNKEFKFGGLFWFYCLLIVIIILIAPKVIYMLATDQVAFEGEEFSFIFSKIIIALFSIVWFFYMISGISVLRIILKNKLRAFTLTDEGIENTAVIFKFFALIIVLPVKLIPWEAIKSYDGRFLVFPHIRVNTKLVDASFIAKLYLKIKGYSFCSIYIKPMITDEDLEEFKHRIPNKKQWL